MTDQFHRTLSLQRLDGVAGSPVMLRLASVRGLVAHVGVLLVTTSALALVNLLVSPESWWAGAILVVWLLVLVAHGLGIVIARLMTDDTTSLLRPDDSPARTEPGWAHSGDPGAGDAAVVSGRLAADPWKDAAPPDDETETSWPSVVTAQPEPDDSGESDRDVASASDGEEERVPWRAATEIAWLRRWQDAKEEDQSQQRNSAS